jgi:hypothetical protein
MGKEKRHRSRETEASSNKMEQLVFLSPRDPDTKVLGTKPLVPFLVWGAAEKAKVTPFT